MFNSIDSLINTAGAKGDVRFETSKDEASRADEFAKIMKQVDELYGTPEERAMKKAQQLKAAQDKKDRDRRINELLGRIAILRKKLSISKRDDKTAAELSALETQLFWLMFSF